jgi:hypothetical protein
VRPSIAEPLALAAARMRTSGQRVRERPVMR